MNTINEDENLLGNLESIDQELNTSLDKMNYQKQVKSDHHMQSIDTDTRITPTNPTV